MLFQFVLAWKCLQVDLLIFSYQTGYQTQLGEPNIQNSPAPEGMKILNTISSSPTTYSYQCRTNKTHSGIVLEKGTGNERSPTWSAGALPVGTKFNGLHWGTQDPYNPTQLRRMPHCLWGQNLMAYTGALKIHTILHN